MRTVFELAGLFVTAFCVGLSGAVMPGPLLAVTIEESTRRGAATGPLVVLGHAFLEAALVTALVLGLQDFLQQRLVLGTIACVGGVLMCWMGQDMLRAARHTTLDGPRVTRRLHPVVAGVVVSLANPYWTIWWATIGLAYLVTGLRFGVAGILVFFTGHILSDLAWYSFVSVGIARGRRVLSDRAYQGLIMACGGALALFGVWFLWTGLHTWRGAWPHP